MELRKSPEFLKGYLTQNMEHLGGMGRGGHGDDIINNNMGHMLERGGDERIGGDRRG